jgi:hypothetical protein
MNPRTINITVSRWRVDTYGPQSLAGFQSELQNCVNTVPEKYRDKTKIEFDVEDEYGSPYLYAEITYSRQETPEEVETREAKELEEAREREAKERATFEYLRKKFNA